MVENALLIQTILWLILVAIFWRSGKATIFHPITFYLAFHGIVFVIRPLFVHYENFDSVWRFMDFEPTEAQFVKALEISSVGMLIFMISCHLGTAKARKLVFSGARIGLSESEKIAFYILVILLLPVIMYSLITMASQVNEDGLPMGEYINGTYIMTNSSGYAYESQSVLVPILALSLLRFRFNILAFIPTVAYFAYRAYIGWGRTAIILSGLGFLMTYCWYQRRTRPPMYIVVAVPVVFLLFAVLGQNRSVVKEFISGQAAESRVLDKSVTWQDKYDTLDFANFDFLAFIGAVVPEKTKTYNYGIDWLQLFTEPIPRKYWKAKPIGPPSFFNLNDYGNFTLLTYSLPGGGWIDGGWAGVVILCSLWGFVLGKIYTWFTWNERSAARGLTYIIAMSVIIQLYRDGNISIFKFWLFTVTPLVLWKVIARKIQPRKRSKRPKLQELDPAKPVLGS